VGCCQKVTHKSDKLKINERLDFVKKISECSPFKIKRESDCFSLNPYFIVIEGTGFEMRFLAWVNIMF